MLVVTSKDGLIILLEEEIKCWESVSGGPNLNAFSFDPKETDPKVLKELGYYNDRESWIAGARIKRLREYIEELNKLPQYTGK
jgi:hypothetical protein